MDIVLTKVRFQWHAKEKIYKYIDLQYNTAKSKVQVDLKTVEIQKHV